MQKGIRCIFFVCHIQRVQLHHMKNTPHEKCAASYTRHYASYHMAKCVTCETGALNIRAAVEALS